MQAIIRNNLHCGDLETFFSGQWSDHASSQSMGQWTDMQLVGREGDGMAIARVKVHRAVILPLCPFLAWMDNDMTGEDLVIILPEYSPELLHAVTNLLDDGDHSSSIAGLVGYPQGLQTCEVNNNICFSAVGSSELPPTPLFAGVPPLPKRRCLSKIVNPPSIVEKPTKKYAKKREATNQIVDNEVGRDDLVILKDPTTPDPMKVPVSKSLAYDQEGEFMKNVTEDLQVNKKKRIKKDSETLDIRKYNCELCEHRCRFLKDLQEHLDLAHNDIGCLECVFKSSSPAVMKTHRKKKHPGINHASGKGEMKSQKKKGRLVMSVGEKVKEEENKDGDEIEDEVAENMLADAALLLAEGIGCELDIRKRSEPNEGDIDELLCIDENDASNHLNRPQNFCDEAKNDCVMLDNIEDLIKEIKNTEQRVEDAAKTAAKDISFELRIPITSDNKTVETTAEAGSISTVKVSAREAFGKHGTAHPAAASHCATVCSARLLAKTKPGVSSSFGRTRREKRGSCPMCGRELGMKMLENHAAWCNGK